MTHEREIDRHKEPDRDIGDVLFNRSEMPRRKPRHDETGNERCENDVHVQKARPGDEDQAQQHGVAGEGRLAEFADDPSPERPDDCGCEKQ
ncbi:hypothetical protein D9M69_666980 [compost metagenome]